MAHNGGGFPSPDPSDGRGRRGFTRPMMLPGRQSNVSAPIEWSESSVGRALESVIGDCAVYDAEGRRPGRVPLAQAAKAAYASDGFVWIGLQQPTAE